MVVLAIHFHSPPDMQRNSQMAMQTMTTNGVDRQAGPSVRVLYVIDGTLAVSGDATMVSTVSAGQGAYSLPGANLVLTAGPAGAHYLTFILTPAS